MDFDEYQELSRRTAGKQPPVRDGVPGELAYCALGLVCEAGEAGDHIKKIVYHGHELDVVTQADLLDELGDVLWYLAGVCSFAGISFSEVAEFNVAKLRKRYPSGFSQERSRTRPENSPTEPLGASPYVTGAWLWYEQWKRWRYNTTHGYVIVEHDEVMHRWIAHITASNDFKDTVYALTEDDAKRESAAMLERYTATRKIMEA